METATLKGMKHTTLVLVALGASVASAIAQNYPPPPPQYQQPYYGQEQAQQYSQPPVFSPQQLDAVVGRIALYPDPLLAQVLTASTFSVEIQDAAGWSRAHAYLPPDQLARAIQDDRLPWDPSVIALLPFPTVLNMMAGEMNWTRQLGDAVLSDRVAVMDAVQRERQLSMSYGYLRSGPQYRVVNGGYGDIEILPVDPAYIYVPVYDPYIVYARPRPGFFVGGAIGFGPRIGISVFAPWGWGGVAFGWRNHAIFVNNRPWERTWVNRGAYVHPYAAPRVEGPGHYVEHHEMHDFPERHIEPRREEPRREERGRGRDR